MLKGHAAELVSPLGCLGHPPALKSQEHKSQLGLTI